MFTQRADVVFITEDRQSRIGEEITTGKRLAQENLVRPGQGANDEHIHEFRSVDRVGANEVKVVHLKKRSTYDTHAAA
jgi:hypothetical protein